MGRIFADSEEIEYARLYGDYCLAIRDSYQKLVSYGIASREFQEANAQAAELRAKMGKMGGPAESIAVPENFRELRVVPRASGDLFGAPCDEP